MDTPIAFKNLQEKYRDKVKLGDVSLVTTNTEGFFFYHSSVIDEVVKSIKKGEDEDHHVFINIASRIPVIEREFCIERYGVNVYRDYKQVDKEKLLNKYELGEKIYTSMDVEYLKDKLE